MKSIVLCTVAVLLMTGCSSKSNFYQLHASKAERYSTSHSAVHSKSTVVGIAEVDLADYLDKPQIVTRLSAGKLQLHEEDRWAGALDKNIQAILTRNLSQALPHYTFLSSPWDEPVEDRYRIYVDVERFDGDMNGTVTLDARWSLVDKEKNRLLIGEKVHYLEQGAAGIDGIVTTQSRMVDRLSRQVAKKIKGHI
jgi:uncharacterized lipoprotein YmbA